MYYRILDLPPIPQDLIDMTLDSVDNSGLSHYLTSIMRPMSSSNKKYPRTVLPPQVESWLRENIIADAAKYEIAVSVDDNGAERLFPHTDRAREYTLMYLLQSGGENHRTVFYESKTIKNIDRMMTFDYNDLVEVDSITVPIKKWTILNAQEIHSVENIPYTRIAIQISIEHNPWAS
jgi:hypothetical protein